jgi:hypothetical protein
MARVLIADPHAVAAAALDGLRDGVVGGGRVLVANRAAHRLIGGRRASSSPDRHHRGSRGPSSSARRTATGSPGCRTSARSRRASPRRPSRCAGCAITTSAGTAPANSDGPAGDAIPDGARILALANAWDAITTDRPYRPAIGADAALAEVERLSAAQFMPDAAPLLREALRWWSAAA